MFSRACCHAYQAWPRPTYKIWFTISPHDQSHDRSLFLHWEYTWIYWDPSSQIDRLVHSESVEEGRRCFFLQSNRQHTAPQDHCSIITLDVDALIGFTLEEVCFDHKIINGLDPHARWLFQPKTATTWACKIIRAMSVGIPIRLRDVDIFIQEAI